MVSGLNSLGAFNVSKEFVDVDAFKHFMAHWRIVRSIAGAASVRVTVLVMICLLMLADLTDNFRGDALGHALIHRAGIGQTIHGPKLSGVRFSSRHQSIRSPDDRAND